MIKKRTQPILNEALKTSNIKSELTYFEQVKHDMFTTTPCVSMECKNEHSRYIKEFYCTVTSPFFAIPLIFYFQEDTLHSLTYQAIAASVIAGIMSTIYHATLYCITSTMDVCCAAIANYIVCLAIISHKYNLRDSMFDHVSTFAVIGLIALYGYNWRKTSHVVIPTMGIGAFSQGIVLLIAGDYFALFVGIIAISCYLLDKLQIAPFHPLWHVFGGIYLYLCLEHTLVE
eukprot:NODE_32_length_37098_cov_1.132760.p15 type:complete len:230 gc:universal NODE_32_length_37098_cov_1.132760:12560-11871(-)